METKYNVVLKGIGDNADADKVTQELAALFKCSVEKVKALLTQPSFIVKGEVAQNVAEKYRAALEGAGAVCAIEPVQAVVEQLDFDVSGGGAVSMPATSTDSAPPKAAESSAETVTFQGNVDNLTKIMNILHGNGLVTSSRCAFDWGKETFTANKDEIASIEEQKHGFGTKLLLTHKNGTQVAVQAANMRGLKAALYALAGLPFDESSLSAPEISQVKNGTAWLAAFMPLIISLLVYLWYGERMAYFGFLSMLKVWLFKLVMIYLGMRIDHLMLQRQGFNTVALGITPPEQFWSYLFSRARAFKQGKGYAITWCVLFGFEMLAALMAFV